LFHYALLTVEEMYRADQGAVRAGVSSLNLMEAAGEGVVRELRRRWPRARPTLVLCGPGNNGGDGFVVARLLRAAGWPVRVMLLGERRSLKGDAAVNARRWPEAAAPLRADGLRQDDLVVDALFGAGLGRPLEGEARETVEAVNRQRLDCVAVDVPSGIDGNTGEIRGAAIQASLTVTFFRPKPGHFLLPGRDRAGTLVVVDIGIPPAVLTEIGPRLWLNDPALWRAMIPWPGSASHKYVRGHAVISGGAEMTGAARLAARAARRVGAGLLTIAAPAATFAVYAGDMPGALVRTADTAAEFAVLLDDARRNAVLVGPGGGVTKETKRRALAALDAGKAAVIDADGLTAFAGHPEELFDAIRSPCVLTPHAGEFSRLFPGEGDKLTRTREAARRAGAVVVLKGSDTVVAAPEGRALIDANGPPELSTGGTGDVLSGLILGLLAQGMDPFSAAGAAVWMQGATARTVGPGLIAEDLPERLPAILRELRRTE
jgi:ADP-dependent NAD(P)H-hydrate dehydratase / NAD(P)H-hydrate epimerase